MNELSGNTQSRASTLYVDRLFNDHFHVRVPSFANFPKLDNYRYEFLRTKSMEERLQKGDILFDIGVADGCVSAIYAQIVGAENLCLFEPEPVVWANIRALWEENN